MKIFLVLFASFISFQTIAQPPVLKCEKDCGTLDINDDFTTNLIFYRKQKQ